MDLGNQKYYTKRTFSGVSEDVRIYTYGGADNIELLGASNSSKMKIVNDLVGPLTRLRKRREVSEKKREK